MTRRPLLLAAGLFFAGLILSAISLTLIAITGNHYFSVLMGAAALSGIWYAMAAICFDGCFSVAPASPFADDLADAVFLSLALVAFGVAAFITIRGLETGAAEAAYAATLGLIWSGLGVGLGLRAFFIGLTSTPADEKDGIECQ